MVEAIEARGWKNIGKLVCLNDKKQIKARLLRLRIRIWHDGRTPCVSVEAVRQAIRKEARRA